MSRRAIFTIVGLIGVGVVGVVLSGAGDVMDFLGAQAPTNDGGTPFFQFTTQEADAGITIERGVSTFTCPDGTQTPIFGSTFSEDDTRDPEFAIAELSRSSANADTQRAFFVSNALIDRAPEENRDQLASLSTLEHMTGGARHRYFVLLLDDQAPLDFRCGAGLNLTEYCGDGAVQSDAGEQCDDGNSNAGDGCSNTCEVEEEYVCAGAPSQCQPHCGDGVLQAELGEQCDDGNDTAGDGCDTQCLIEPGYTCSGEPSSCELSNPFEDIIDLF